VYTGRERERERERESKMISQSLLTKIRGKTWTDGQTRLHKESTR
jgi:hypothetical protein